MPIQRSIRYTGNDVTVLWKPHLVHPQQTMLAEPAGRFKPGERPWIIPDGADAQEVIDQVRQCPSGGAEHRHGRNRGISGHRDPDVGYATIGDERNTIVEVNTNGPLLVKGTVEVKHADGRIELKEKQCALCRCGASGNKPYCDGSHRKIDFQG